MSKTISYSADIGSVRIWNNSVVIFLPNGVGDGRFKVSVLKESDPYGSKSWQHGGLFILRDPAYISCHDCEDNEGIKLQAGVYFWSRDNEGNVRIRECDIPHWQKEVKKPFTGTE